MSRAHASSPFQTDRQFSLFDETMALRQDRNATDLPATARELVDVMGIEATIDLVKMFGGDDLRIPEVVNGTSRMWDILVETVGPQAAAKLVDRCAGTVIYVPKCQAALIKLRDTEIIRRYDAGESFDKLRREHNITRRHLFRILKKPL